MNRLLANNSVPSGQARIRRRVDTALIRSRAIALALFLFLSLAVQVNAQTDLEDRKIARIDIAFAGTDRDVSSFERFRLVAGNALGERYSAVKVRSALQDLYETDRIVSAIVEAEPVGNDEVIVRFTIKRISRAAKVSVNVGEATGSAVTEAQILLQLNLLSPGSTVSDRILEENGSAILTYLRDRGYFEAEVNSRQEPLQNDTEVSVFFDVMPGKQARMGKFDINVEKLNKEDLLPRLKLQTGNLFSRADLESDIDQIRAALREQKFLAPNLGEARIVFENETNTIDIEVSGDAGPVVDVEVDSGSEKISDKTRLRLLPLLREGTLDYSAIVEGERRLENHFQEKGYFFASATPYCSVEPAFSEDEATVTENGTEELCTALTGAELEGRTVSVKYDVDLNRRLKLVDIRLEGTDKFSVEEIATILESQEASIIGIVPYLGYGRGYTSLDLLQKDRQRILSVMAELGYRQARVGVKQGVSPDGEDLIITFVVEEGIQTTVAEVQIADNVDFSDGQLRSELPKLEGGAYSRAKARNGVRRLAQFYADHGYFDASVSFAIEELPDKADADHDEVKLIFSIENEGKRVLVNRILVSGTEQTKEKAILKSIDLKPGTVLRQTDLFTSEQNLYSTDAFDTVEVKPEPAGESPDGAARLSDILVSVDEKPSRLITYGGGYSTDLGFSGFFDIRHFNLFGSLHQGGAQVRVSQRQQLVQFDYVRPRFISDGKDKNGKRSFASLTLSAQYQRDTTVTRFFRSTFDQGTFGIVQRVDENGTPIDVYGNPAGDPTINRFTLSAETSRTLSRKDRTIVFFRYGFEDVRLYNIESLLIADLLRPDAKVRLSGFTVTLARDTRKNCSVKFTLLDMISKGEPGEPCRYNAGDPTEGDYLTAEYKLSTPALGANIGFNRLQISYNRYYTINALRKTTFAGRVILGLSNVFAGGDRFTGTEYEGLNGILPISERFFAGGSTTLRGFDFETAGPRVVVVPEGTFIDQQGDEITLDPFTVPFGGNGMAIVNLEARVPINKSLRAVPFYDGGNVYRTTSEIFKPAAAIPGDPFQTNLAARWSHTVGLGFRYRTPFGGEFAVDYGYLLNPPKFIIPNDIPPDGVFRLYQGQFHFRFSQAF